MWDHNSHASACDCAFDFRLNFTKLWNRARHLSLQLQGTVVQIFDLAGNLIHVGACVCVWLLVLLLASALAFIFSFLCSFLHVWNVCKWWMGRPFIQATHSKYTHTHAWALPTWWCKCMWSVTLNVTCMVETPVLCNHHAPCRALDHWPTVHGWFPCAPFLNNEFIEFDWQSTSLASAHRLS